MSYSKLMAYGQIEKGDKLVIVGRDGRVNRKKVREVLHSGTKNEEVIISKASNSYFITSMVLAGSSWAKAVAYEPNSSNDKANRKKQRHD